MKGERNTVVRTKKDLLKSKKNVGCEVRTMTFSSAQMLSSSSSSSVRLHNVSHVNLSKPLTVPERSLSIAGHMLRFFSEHEEYWERFYTIHRNVTGRLLNFLFTTYAPRFPRETTYMYYNSTIGGNVLFHIRHQYETLLKAYRKHGADTFGRGGVKIFLEHPSDPARVIVTTVPKANLIFWMIENHVDQYVLQEQATIKRAMAYYVAHKALDGFSPYVDDQQRCRDDMAAASMNEATIATTMEV